MRILRVIVKQVKVNLISRDEMILYSDVSIDDYGPLIDDLLARSDVERLNKIYPNFLSQGSTSLIIRAIRQGASYRLLKALPQKTEFTKWEERKMLEDIYVDLRLAFLQSKKSKTKRRLALHLALFLNKWSNALRSYVVRSRVQEYCTLGFVSLVQKSAANSNLRQLAETRAEFIDRPDRSKCVAILGDAICHFVAAGSGGFA